MRGILDGPVYNNIEGPRGGNSLDYTKLIQAMQDRRPGAMEEVQTAFTPMLHYIIAPILPDTRDAEECLSDVLLQAWNTIASYDPARASLSTWLTHLARNAALNRRRSNQRRRESTALDETVPDSREDPEQSFLKAEQAQALWAAVGRLRWLDQQLFLRKYYYYQLTAQIAAELGLTVRAVEGRLYRIRRRLQRELGGVYHG